MHRREAGSQRKPRLTSSPPPQRSSARAPLARNSLWPGGTTTPAPASAPRTRLPEVVVHALGSEQPAECHLEPVADRHAFGVDVRELAREATTPLVVDERGHHGRLERVRQVIEGIGG